MIQFFSKFYYHSGNEKRPAQEKRLHPVRVHDSRLQRQIVRKRHALQSRSFAIAFYFGQLPQSRWETEDIHHPGVPRRPT
jgi:hypothetical protein